jgi:large subunit ribosomal protein L9
MKVILNKDLAPLGEEGDVKEVARGYARNYLFPRGIALPYTERTVKLFESRQAEIDARKAQKRQDASGLKERLSALELSFTMPAGPNGKLYGAVTNQTIADELAKQDFVIERKRIEVPGNNIKSVGKYKVIIKLYENASAEVAIVVQGEAVKEEPKAAALQRKERRHNDDYASRQVEQSDAVAEAIADAEAEAAPSAE